MNMTALQHFLKYIRIDTQSDDTTGTTPSTEKQKVLGNLLVEELLSLGLNDAHMDEWGNVYGHLPGKGSRIGLNAHMDTALEVTDTDVKPHMIRNYQGGKIQYANGLVMTPVEFPNLLKHKGHDLIITDGNTLLGADDKAGIAIIMGVLEYFHEHPEVKHSTICVCFTVDEEIGEGPNHFNYRKMDAKYAYTIDGSDIEKVEYENFNAYCADITVKGVSIHPGEGKDKLINACLVMNELLSQLPKQETPFYTSGKEGFFHVTSMEGTSELMKAHIIIRDFSYKGIDKRLDLIEKIVNKTQKLYPTATISWEKKKQYENMRKYVENKPIALKRIRAVYRKCGIEPITDVIRGGTDGATFSKNGLVTPNLGTGSYNHHGRFEYLDVQEMNKMVEVVTELMKK